MQKYLSAVTRYFIFLHQTTPQILKFRLNFVSKFAVSIGKYSVVYCEGADLGEGNGNPGSSLVIKPQSVSLSITSLQDCCGEKRSCW